MDSVSTTLTTFRPRCHGDASVPDNALPTAQDDAASKKMLDETIQNLGVEVLILPTVNFVDPVRRTSPQTRALTRTPIFALTRTRTLHPTWTLIRSRSRPWDRTLLLTQR